MDRIGSFIQQLIEIQQKQHDTASIFAKDLKSFKDHVSAVKSLYSNYSSSDDESHRLPGLVHSRDAIFKCMWQQKVSPLPFFMLVFLKFIFVEAKNKFLIQCSNFLILYAPLHTMNCCC